MQLQIAHFHLQKEKHQMLAREFNRFNSICECVNTLSNRTKQLKIHVSFSIIHLKTFAVVGCLI